MAIAFDNAATFATTTGSSATQAFTTSGSNRILFVTMSYNTTTDRETSVTYNGVAMARIGTITGGVAGYRTSLWWLQNPASGSHNCVVTFNAAVGFFEINIASFTGAKQTGAIDSSNTNTATSATSFALSTTVVANNSWLVSASRDDGGGSSAGSNTTIRAGGGASGAILASTSTAQAAGSRSLNFTNSAVNWQGVVASFAPVDTTTGAAFLLNMV